MKKAVDVLLSLKADFKSASGQDWSPSYQPTPTNQNAPPTPKSAQTANQNAPAPTANEIAAQGELVRRMKAEKADQVCSCACCSKVCLLDDFDWSNCIVLIGCCDFGWFWLADAILCDLSDFFFWRGLFLLFVVMLMMIVIILRILELPRHWI